MMSSTSINTEVTRYIVCPAQTDTENSNGLLKDAHALGLHSISEILSHDLYFIKGNISSEDSGRIADELLYDPVTQRIEWHEIGEKDIGNDNDIQDGLKVIEVALRPGVTDPVAVQILRAAQVIGIQGIYAVSTGQRFLIRADNITDEECHLLARKLLANPTIQHYSIGPIQPSFPEELQSSGETELISVRDLDDEQLMQLSQERRAALNLEEMKTIQLYCRDESRDLTDVEFEMIAQTWSEHCVHKTFKSRIDVEVEPGSSRQYKARYDNLFNETIKAATKAVSAPWVLSAFTDNAGIIVFDEDHEVSFKVETHNHPSAIEPFGGANTGTGGVIRDVIGVSAKPIAATDILCFGPQDLDFKSLPEGVLHPRRIFSGVVAGIEDYGNKIGIPTVNGAVLFDEGYISNPLVYCGCVGIAPRGSQINKPQEGDRIVVLGGRTGRDGLRGATFSSQTMDAQTGDVAGSSVQIGAPIVEKGLIDVIMQARDEKLYNAITDCGAGGLSSAVGEMTSKTGGDVELAQVPLKYPGLVPWEIWLSEAQERMVLAVAPENLARLQEICDLYNVELTDIGEFNQTGRIVARYDGKVVLDLDNRFLHDGIPQRSLKAKIQAHPESLENSLPGYKQEELENILIKLLAHPSIASKEQVVRVYDHEVLGGTLVKPLTGVMNDGPSDACVIKPQGTGGKTAMVLSNGINPQYGKWDAYKMALNVIDEAVRNAVAVGADPERIAILDNFCWGNPDNAETLGTLVEAAQACYDGAIAYQTPFISGKDSFYNEYLGRDGKRHAIPPSLVISAIGIIPDWQKAVTMDLKNPGDVIYLVGEWKPAFGGSHFNLVVDQNMTVDESVPGVSENTSAIYRQYYQAVRQGWVSASHDLSEGGLSVSAAEMCIASKLGMELELTSQNAVRLLFGETSGCLLVEVPTNHAAQFEKLFDDTSILQLGYVVERPYLKVSQGDQTLFDCSIETLVSAWKKPIH